MGLYLICNRDIFAYITKRFASWNSNYWRCSHFCNSCYSPFQFSLSFDDYLNGFLMAGIAEEIVFRGLILQEINKKWLFGKQILLQLSYFWS
ncbi:CPBP family glutamic-type intramembrane protease [Metabacillus rhizolycopersici]|uniref:CAAX prenyl protease 2/Lysostaphin resistance protein A-like domain-containing protein n=1 Tax=Metabacillus rhizolycopersici TaxID=2875709 RepID=A0ABS7UZY1_9BACI|nr:CPBP family glutamic-type intramembrane protease [Metabacillus rhizolycopersici]MBZ5753890.1 hypothetical protein [Metabacillus rhizolycopersici]